MEQLSLILFWFSTALYAAASVLYGYNFLSRRSTYSWYATFLTGAGFMCQTASIGLRSTITEGTVLTGGNSLVLAAWALVLVYFVVEHFIKLKLYGAVLVPIAAILMLAAQIVGLEGGAGMSARDLALLNSWRVGVHVALIVFANAGFLIGAVASIVYLLQERQLKEHRVSTLFRRLPSLAQTDLIARRVIAFAYPAYTAGLALGVVRAIETDVGGWWADPRVMLAGVVWALFGVYLVLHYRLSISGRKAAWLAISGGLLVLVLAVVARTVPAGFHIFGVPSARTGGATSVK